MPIMNITDELLDQLEELEKEWVRRYEEEYLGGSMGVKSDSNPQQFVVSKPPSGYKPYYEHLLQSRCWRGGGGV